MQRIQQTRFSQKSLFLFETGQFWPDFRFKCQRQNFPMCEYTVYRNQVNKLNKRQIWNRCASRNKVKNHDIHYVVDSKTHIHIHNHERPLKAIEIICYMCCALQSEYNKYSMRCFMRMTQLNGDINALCSQVMITIFYLHAVSYSTSNQKKQLWKNVRKFSFINGYRSNWRKMCQFVKKVCILH